MKNQETCSSLAILVNKAIGQLFKNTVIVTVLLVIGSGFVFTWFVQRPGLAELESVKKKTEEALVKRNHELVRTSVEQAADNITRILGSAENALTDLTSVLSSFSYHGTKSKIFPVEKEFRAGGQLEKLLGQQQGYSDPVSFETPQIKLSNVKESKNLFSVSGQFLNISKRLHTQNPELKWIYLGSQLGNFMVFPSSPMIPADFDPRTRPWFSKAIQAGKSVWVSPYFTAGGNDLVLTVAAPIEGNSAFKGAVAGVDVVMTDIINNLLSTPYCDKCMFYLVDEKGEVLGKRGGTVQGQSWEKLPSTTLFTDEISKNLTKDQANELSKKVFSESTYLRKNDGLSRAPKAVAITSETIPVILLSAPISKLNWKLIGVVPTGYVGADGDAVVLGVTDLIYKAKSQFLTFIIAVLILIALVIYIMFRIARASVQKTLSPAIKQFSRLTNKLDLLNVGKSDEFESDFKSENAITDEYIQIVTAIKRLLEKLDLQTKERETLRIQAEMGRLASQVAHDIRSPLAALTSLEQDFLSLPESRRILTRKAINKINDIANNLLLKNREQAVDISAVGMKQNLADVHLFLSVDSAISEVRQKYDSKENISIELNSSPEAMISFVKADKQQLQRLLSNIINNSVEACDPKGNIKTDIRVADKFIEISVIDNGKGIPSDLIPRLGTMGTSFGKTDGNGMGLFHAKSNVEAWGGKIEITSQLNKGTTIKIRLPSISTPSWFCNEIVFDSESTVAILDDDESVHGIWERRFDEVEYNKLYVKHFFESPSLKNWFDQFKSRGLSITLLCDYELGAEKVSGIDIIKDLHLENNAVLVTSRADEESVIELAKKTGIRILPKQLVSSVQFKKLAKEKIHMALIDDDDLTRSTWALLASDKKINIAVFENLDSFLESKIAHNVPIYIDLHLGSGVSGIDVAVQLKELGYSKLHIATGDSLKKDYPPFIQSVNGKEFPEAIL